MTRIANTAALLLMGAVVFALTFLFVSAPSAPVTAAPAPAVVAPAAPAPVQIPAISASGINSDEEFVEGAVPGEADATEDNATVTEAETDETSAPETGDQDETPAPSTETTDPAPVETPAPSTETDDQDEPTAPVADQDTETTVPEDTDTEDDTETTVPGGVNVSITYGPNGEAESVELTDSEGNDVPVGSIAESWGE